MDKFYCFNLLLAGIFGLMFFLQAQIGYAQSSIVATEVDNTSESCGNGSMNKGSITFEVTGTSGTDYYRVTDLNGNEIYPWGQFVDTVMVDELVAGDYFLEIYDDNEPIGNPFQQGFTILDERPIVITPVVRNVQCFGDDPVGSVRFEVKTIDCGSNNIKVSYKKQSESNYTSEQTIGLGNGKSEYIKYSDGTINFPVGDYDFKVRQGGGNCTDCGTLDFKIKVEGPSSALEMDEADIATQDITCSGTTYYEATANPRGGWGGYTYLWSDGQTTKTATYLSPGNTYTVTVTDSGGCEVQVTKTMPGSNSTSMSITPTITDPTCGVDNGAIKVEYTDIDTTQYEITWRKDDPDTGTVVSGTQDSIDNLSPGIYFLILTDNNDSNCKITREFELIEEGTPVSVDPSAQEICEGESVVFTPSIAPTTGNYTFNWYHDIDKVDPVIDNSALGPQEVVYDIDASGVLTITGLPYDEIDNTYSYFVDVSGDNVCETPAGELKEVEVGILPRPESPEVIVSGGSQRF